MPAATTIGDLLEERLRTIDCECGREYMKCDEFDGHCPVCEAASLRDYIKELKDEQYSCLSALAETCSFLVGPKAEVCYRLAKKLLEEKCVNGHEANLTPMLEEAIQQSKEREAAKEKVDGPERDSPGGGA